MTFLVVLFLAFSSVVAGFTPPRLARRASPLVGRRNLHADLNSSSHTKRCDNDTAKTQSTFHYPTFNNAQAQNFEVVTRHLPLFEDLAVQDTWAGRLPVKGSVDEYFFWYFPSSEKGGSKRLTIWLNGGPGCSSMEGAIAENGAVVWSLNQTKPALNKYGWTTVSDMLYIDQPAGVGYATGNGDDLTGEIPLANDFYHFLESFFGVFSELLKKDLYIAGESYAGFYIPYITQRIMKATAAERAAMPLSPKGVIMSDGVYADILSGDEIPVASFATAHASLLGLNKTYVRHLQHLSASCGYDAVLAKLKYPQPPGLISLPNAATLPDKCDVFSNFYQACLEANPCFDIYNVAVKCPVASDADPVLGTSPYFARADVQAALHVPSAGTWTECTTEFPFVDQYDHAPPSQTIIPQILKDIPVLMWHGLIDGRLFAVSDRLTIQNMTWNGHQGFTKAPDKKLYVDGKVSGNWRTERNLTYIEVANSGHMIPQDQPKVAHAVFKQFLETGNIGDGSLDVSGPRSLKEHHSHRSRKSSRRPQLARES